MFWLFPDDDELLNDDVLDEFDDLNEIEEIMLFIDDDEYWCLKMIKATI